MAGTWRAFIGDDDLLGRTVEDVRGLPWAEARDVLLAFAREELDAHAAPGSDRCRHCEAAARDAVAELSALPEGTPWEGDIDWDDLRLLPDEEAKR